MGIKVDAEKLQILGEAAPLAAKFKRIFTRDISANFIAEIYAAYEYELELQETGNAKSFDGVDKNGSRYEVKQRSPSTLNVDLNTFDFDFLILVNLDDSLRLKEMWRISQEQAKQIFTYREKYRKYQVTQVKLKSVAERIK